LIISKPNKSQKPRNKSTKA